MVLVSACLWGENTRYDGQSRPSATLRACLAGHKVLPLCPEVLGGLAVPRPPARFVNARPGQEGRDLLAGRARLLTGNNVDVSQAFINGARKVVELVLRNNIKKAFLKDRSPSCACDLQGVNPKAGIKLGVLSALLIDNGIEVEEIRA